MHVVAHRPPCTLKVSLQLISSRAASTTCRRSNRALTLTLFNFHCLLSCLPCRAGGMALTALGLYTPPRRRAHSRTTAAAAGADTQQRDQQEPQQLNPQGKSGSSSSSSAAALATAGTAAALGAEVIDWGAPIRSSWDISERGALQLLGTFLTSAAGLSAYESARSYADGRSVSKLSPYLHWGQLSPRLMWQRMKVAK